MLKKKCRGTLLEKTKLTQLSICCCRLCKLILEDCCIFVSTKKTPFLLGQVETEWNSWVTNIEKLKALARREVNTYPRGKSYHVTIIKSKNCHVSGNWHVQLPEKQ